MGLDTVELIMAIEEEFDLEISDEDAEKLVTVGAIHDYVCAKLVERGPNPDASTQPCASAHVFYLLRSALMEMHQSRGEITPGTPLQSIFPGADPRDEWKSLQQRLGLKLPELERPTWLVVVIVLLPAGTGLAVNAYLGYRNYNWLSGLVAAICLLAGLLFLTKSA